MTANDDVAAKQISELEAKRYQAMTDADTATLDGLFSAGLVYTHSDASSDSKQSYLDGWPAGTSTTASSSTRKPASWCAGTAPSSSVTCAARSGSAARRGC
jgi:hypothetical protein